MVRILVFLVVLMFTAADLRAQDNERALSRLDNVAVTVAADPLVRELVSLEVETAQAGAELQAQGIGAAPGQAVLQIRLLGHPVDATACLFVAEGLLTDQAGESRWVRNARAKSRCDDASGPRGLARRIASELALSVIMARGEASKTHAPRATAHRLEYPAGPVATNAHRVRPEVAYDSALVLEHGAPVRQGPSATEDVVRTVEADEQLAIIRRPQTRDMWINVVHVASGTEGYVSRQVVEVVLARRTPKLELFVEQDAKTHKSPELVIENHYGAEMTFRFEGRRHVVPAGDSLSVSTLPGEKEYVVYAADAVPAVGHQKFKSGYKYLLSYVVR